MAQKKAEPRPPGPVTRSKFVSSDTLTQKRLFVQQLASFLCGNQAIKSMMTEMPGANGELAREWAALRSVTPLFGWIDEVEALAILNRWLLD